MKIIERVFEIIELKGVSVAEFERESSLSNGYLRKQRARNADVGETIILNILDHCPEINAEWLLTGQGSMLRNAEQTESAPLQNDKDALAQAQETISDLRYTIEMQKQTIDLLREKITLLQKNNATTDTQSAVA